MNNYEKQQLAIKIALAAFERAGITTKLRKAGKVTQILDSKRWHDVHGNTNGFWVFEKPFRDKILVYQETPTKYKIYVVPAREMEKLVTIYESDNFKDGKVEIDLKAERVRWPNQGHERAVLDMRQAWLRRELERFQRFN